MRVLLCLLLFISLAATLHAAAYSSPYIDIVQNGRSFSNFSGWYNNPVSGWFDSGSTIYSAWSGVWAEYTAYLTPGNWNIGINVQNSGQLDSRYPAFQVQNSLNGQILNIAASQTEINYGYVNTNITQAGNVTVRFTWLNDWCVSPYDANIIYNSVFFDNTANATLSASNTNFGNVRVGTSANASVSVTNTGQSGSTLTGSIGAASGSEFSPVSGTQSFSLGQNQSASRTFTYTPNARGNDSTTVSISSNATNTTRTLTGTGVSPVYSSSVSPNSTIDFGTVDKNQTLTQAFTIQNLTPDSDLGNLTNLTLLSASISGIDAESFSLSGFTPGTVLSKNGSFTFFINATNLDNIVRYRNATLTIVTDENAALGIAGNVYTYQLLAYTVPEPSSCILFGIVCLFLWIYRHTY